MSNQKDIFKDERFAHLLSNPRFKKLPKKEGKVKIDERFKSMFESEKFNIQYNVDKYGRKVDKKSSENLRNYYDLDSDESSEDEVKDDDQLNTIPGNAVIKGGNKLPATVKEKLQNLEIDYIRGEGVLQSDSSDEESSSEDEDEIVAQHDWGELDKDAERTEDSSRRIACMHMDWDKIRAVDIMVLCNSFIPTGSGSVLSVKIYPSQFGKERMAEEDIKGPQEITKLELENEETVDEQDEIFVEKLREYQLNRLKYYYAVVEFDSVKSADIVYKECDGLEYESTANRLDLRFIPDDMEFEDEPKDECSELPDLSKYEPRIFFTSALQHANMVELTWDETDVGRKEISEKLFSDKIKEVSDQELRKYVAFSSESENESENESQEDVSDGKGSSKNKLDLYKALLDDVNKKEEEKKKQQVEMEYSWGIGSLDKKSNKEEILSDDKEELTPFERILEKKKQKKKAKKELRKKKVKGETNEDENGYSSSDFDDIDMNDPYFAEEFANGEFKMPTKKLNNKKKNKKGDLNEDSESEEKLKAQKELELLLDDNEEEKSHFSLKKIQENEQMSSSKKKRILKKLKKQGITAEEPSDNFELNVKDERFSAVYSQPDFNIDPTNSGYKKTKGMEKLIQEKLKRRQTEEDAGPSIEPVKKKIKDVSLNVLVKNIKKKVGK